ncbi:hypothetical protein H2202_000089 [Exophiala xenobiotica]|nr:hypothetical protein H2202_000089 [Exophiala xenobiotica]
MAETTPSSSPQVNSYHCLCSVLILATVHDLQYLPNRTEPVRDDALILPPPIDVNNSDELSITSDRPAESVLLNTVLERKAVVIRREDGFEKRRLLSLEGAHFANAEKPAEPVYLLPGGLVTTADMSNGVKPETPSWAQSA